MAPCDPKRGTKNWGCSWHGVDNLHLMMEQQTIVRAGGGYNEVLLDAQPWVAHLPSTIEAMFVLAHSEARYWDDVRQVHRDFLVHYNLAEGDGPPIVVYDPLGAPTSPFSGPLRSTDSPTLHQK